jgi:hypothetical protein
LLKFCGIGLPKAYFGFENCFSNKSQNFNLNSRGYNFAEHPKGRICFANGIGNTFEDMEEKALFISKLTGLNTYGSYGATHTPVIDMHEAAMNLVSHTRTPAVYNFHEIWNGHFDVNPDVPLLQFTHSRGNIQLRNALDTYPKERRDFIIVAAIAPGAYISKDMCKQVRHYACDSDIVTYIDFAGRKAHKETIVHIKRDPMIKQSGHEFLNPIYLPHIKAEIEEYQNLLKNYAN